MSKENSKEVEVRNKIVELIETSGYKLLPSAKTEILAMISEYSSAYRGDEKDIDKWIEEEAEKLIPQVTRPFDDGFRQQLISERRRKQDGFVIGARAMYEKLKPKDEDAIAFADWLNDNRWFSKEDGMWCYTFEQGTAISKQSYRKHYMKTTQQLYEIFKNK